MAEATKKTKLQRRLEYLKNHPEEAWQAEKPLILEPCKENSKCNYCRNGCYKCTKICSVSGLNTPWNNKSYNIRFTMHALERMVERQIHRTDVEEMLYNDMHSDCIHLVYSVDERKKEMVVKTMWPLRKNRRRM